MKRKGGGLMHRSKWSYFLFLSVMLLTLFSACTPQATEIPPIPTQMPPSATAAATNALTSIPDLCAPNNVVDQVRKIHNVMRKFDDFVYVANLTPQAQLSPIIIDLLAARRETEDLDVPVCLSTLQIAALNYQNTVIDYLAQFMGGGTKEQINSQMAASQNLRITYEAELARLIGATYVPPSTATPLPTSSTPGVVLTGTPAAGPSDAQIKNPGPTAVNLRNAPSFDAGKLGDLAVGETAKALAHNQTMDWILIEDANVPGGMAWVYAKLVELNIAITQLPVVVPAPSPTPAG
jgi:hypothetical protein